jgi:hypothetical protein
MLLGSAMIRFVDTKARIDYLKEAVFLTPIHDDAIPVEWDECSQADLDANDVEREPAFDAAEYGPLPAVAGKARSYAGWSKDLVNWICSHQQLSIQSSAGLKLFSLPEESESDFRLRLHQSMREERDAMVAKLRQKYAPKVATLEDRLRRAEQAVQREKDQQRTQALDAVVSVGTGVFGALFGRKKLATAAGGVLRGAGRAQREHGDVARAEETVGAIQAQLRDLQAQFDSEMSMVQQRMDASSEPLDVVVVKPKKANVQVRLLTLAWVPYTPTPDGQLQAAWK